LAPNPPHDVLDLGSGGGLPGLVLLDRWRCWLTLLDSMEKRSEFLREVLGWLDAPASAAVVTARAEEAARWPEFDGQFDLVTARSFGPPAVTVECAARFLRVGGILIVSEPPPGRTEQRWPAKGLDVVGFEDLGRRQFDGGYQVLRKVTATASSYPRAVGVPKKKPLF